MSATPNIELLKRHKANRDAGIITQEEFMEIYHGIMNEGANIQQVSNSSSSSSQSNPLLRQDIVCRLMRLKCASLLMGA